MEPIVAELIIIIGGLWLISQIVNVVARFLISLFETLVRAVSAIVLIYSLFWLVQNLELFIRY